MYGSTPKVLKMGNCQCQLIHKYVIPYVKLNTSTSFISKLAFIFKLYVHQKLFNYNGISKCLTYMPISTCTENIVRKQLGICFIVHKIKVPKLVHRTGIKVLNQWQGNYSAEDFLT